MIITEKSRVFPFQKIDPTDEEIKLSHIPEEFLHIIPYLTKIGDSLYCYKGLRTPLLINELIGSYLSHRIGLDTVDYEIGKRESDGALFALSKVFYEEGYQYQSVASFLEEHHYKNCWKKLGSPILQLLPVYYNMNTLKLYRGTPFYDHNLKLIAVDLKMAQHDRHKTNMQIKIDSRGTIDLAPLYDYSRAYNIHFDLSYANPFVFIRYTPRTLELLFSRYPELRDYVEFLRKVSIEEILQGIEEEKGILFTPEEHREYQLCQEQNDKLIDQAIKVKK